MRLLLAVICATALAVACGTALAVEAPLYTEGPHAGALPPNSAINLQSFVKLARSLGPAVVNVVALAGSDETAHDAQKPRGKGQGTGFIIHKSGYILTNAHVIESADDVRVRLADERELTAQLVGKDDRTDIALLKIDAGVDLPVAPLGNSDDLQIG